MITSMIITIVIKKVNFLGLQAKCYYLIPKILPFFHCIFVISSFASLPCASAYTLCGNHLIPGEVLCVKTLMAHKRFP